MSEKQDIVVIGESLIELSTNESLTEAKSLDKYYGGDSLTSAITALRLGSKVGFISRVGMDCFQDYLLESWNSIGLVISNVKLSLTISKAFSAISLLSFSRSR